MNFRTKQTGITFTVSTLMIAGVLNAQGVRQGLNYLNNDQFSKAKEVFENLVSQSPTADNYYYLGNYYLKIKTPDVDQAILNFNKGLASDPKSNLNKIGLAEVKLYKGDKSSADKEFQAIAEDTRYRNAEVLYQIANAYILFKTQKKSMDPDKSIEYSQKLLELVKNKDRAEYYVTLGNAYYQKSEPGDAMTKYSRALEIAEDNKSKAGIYALIANLWSRTGSNNSGLAEENFKKAKETDPDCAIAYRLHADYGIREGDYKQALVNFQKYMELTGNDGADSQLYLAQISYLAKDYNKTSDLLNKNWDSISDPLKYKVKALVLMETPDFSGAYTNMEQYFQMVPEADREGSDYGVLGKIQSSLAITATGEEKNKLTKEAIENLKQAQIRGDKSYDYEILLAGLSGVKPITSPKIEELKKKIEADPNDTKSWYDLAFEQYDAKDYSGSVISWGKLSDLIPDWATPYAGKGMALYAMDTSDANGLAAQSYQKYIDMVAPKNEYSEAEKEYLEIAYTFFAYKSFHEKNKEKTQEYIDKTLALNPKSEDIINLQKQMK